jgi:diguanylate cyclase (GGDEF)-like protein
MINTDSKGLKVILKKYRAMVSEYTQAKADMSIILASEEFKLHNIRSNISHIQSQYKKDHLTGCLNRYSLEEDWKTIIKRYNDISVVFFDLDNLKYVNDTLGHDFGDEVLCKICELWNDVQEYGDYIARLGGDEFALIIENYRDDEHLENHVSEFKNKINKPQQIRVSIVSNLCPILYLFSPTCLMNFFIFTTTFRKDKS